MKSPYNISRDKVQTYQKKTDLTYHATNDGKKKKKRKKNGKERKERKRKERKEKGKKGKIKTVGSD